MHPPISSRIGGIKFPLLCLFVFCVRVESCSGKWFASVFELVIRRNAIRYRNFYSCAQRPAPSAQCPGRHQAAARPLSGMGLRGRLSFFVAVSDPMHRLNPGTHRRLSKKVVYYCNPLLFQKLKRTRCERTRRMLGGSADVVRSRALFTQLSYHSIFYILYSVWCSRCYPFISWRPSTNVSSTHYAFLNSKNDC